MKTRQKQLERHKEWRIRNPDKIKLANRRSNLARVGLTPEQYDEMHINQKGVCLICNNPPGARSLAVDHCHTTNKIRGLLCYKCNIALGYFQDSEHILHSAIQYLNQNKTK